MPGPGRAAARHAEEGDVDLSPYITGEYPPTIASAESLINIEPARLFN
jgi:hypothetical protein